jgi:hypothetical protein
LTNHTTHLGGLPSQSRARHEAREGQRLEFVPFLNTFLHDHFA